jgi:hypothetical protein
MVKIPNSKIIVVLCFLCLFFRKEIAHAQSPNWLAPPAAKAVKLLSESQRWELVTYIRSLSKP